jgi:glucokinase
MSTADAIAFPVLIGDIGGTNARFALLPDPEARPIILQPLATADFPDMEAAIEANVLPHSPVPPRSAIIDLAGPIKGDAVPLTNAHWVVRPRETIERLGVHDVILLNDFEALALALTALQPRDVVVIGGGNSDPHGAKVVVGPGTGLGVGALVRAGDVWTPVPGEGGHVALGPAEADEFPVWAHIEPEHGRVSAEALICGRGIVRLYRAVVAAEAGAPTFTKPEEITEAALAESDPHALRTINLYSRLLGRLAGDLALIFMARGGVYIGGGIPPRILPILSKSEFRRAFEAKAPHQEIMAAIPTFVIVDEAPALHGLAALARAPERFGVNFSGRRWRR